MSDSGMNRRTFIRTSLAGSALLTVGGLGWGLSAGERAPDGLELQRLDRRSYAILSAVADRMCQAGEGAPTAADVGVVDKIDTLLSSLPLSATRELKQALLLFESPLYGAVMERRFLPFTQCDAKTQDRVLAAWRDSRWAVRRTVYDALHSLCMAPYWADPRLWSRVGYPGPPDAQAMLQGGV